jgi:hypothetical protein
MHHSVFRRRGKGRQRHQHKTNTQLDEFAVKFEKEFSLVSYLSTRMIKGSVWYLDSGGYHHMTEAKVPIHP